MTRNRSLVPMLVAGACIALMLGVCVGFYLPLGAKYGDLKARAAAREGTHDLNATVAKAAELEEIQRAKEQKLALWQEVLGRTPNAREILKRINACLQRCGLEIGLFAPLPPNATTRHAQVSQRHYHQIAFETTFPQLAAFLRLWKELPYLARIERLQIVPLREDGAMRLSASLYYSVYERATQASTNERASEEKQ